MPIFGMKNPRGAFVAIVKGLVYEQLPSIEAVKGVYKVFPRFNINGMYFDAYEDIVVDFYPLVGDQVDYSGMAKVYRDYQIGRGEVRLLRDRVKDNPVLAYSADSMYVRVKHCRKKVDPKNPAHRMQTPETEPPLEIFHDFDDFTDIMKRMRAEGIEKAEICSVGWNIGGHDGRFPQYFPVEPKIGGEAKFRESIKIATRWVQYLPHNQFAILPISRWYENDVAKRPTARYGLHLSQRDSVPPVFRARLHLWVRTTSRHRHLGIKGLFHIDVTSMSIPIPAAIRHRSTGSKRRIIKTRSANTHVRFAVGSRRRALRPCRQNPDYRFTSGIIPPGRTTRRSSPQNTSPFGSSCTTASS